MTKETPEVETVVAIAAALLLKNGLEPWGGVSFVMYENNAELVEDIIFDYENKLSNIE